MKVFLYLTTIIMSVCAMVYEFLIAESLTAVMGNTILRYNTTIGVYIASMGLGALIIDHVWNKLSTSLKFFYTEFLLSCFGLMSINCIILANYYFVANQVLLNFVSYFFVIAIGALTGFEIPLMIKLYSEKYNDSIGKVLFFDYFGSFLGAIMFPFIILPSTNILNIGSLFSLINIVMALSLGYYLEIMNKKLLVISLGIIVLNLFYIYYDISSKMIEWFYV